MGTRYKDYPIYTYDEPAVYSDFFGGLNTDPSNDHLIDSELRDVTNMTYLSGALVKRKGAKKLCEVSSPEILEYIQGVFLFTYRITYLIVAADGKLFQGVFNENAPITLERLYIRRPKEGSDLLFDENDVFAGLEELSKYDLSETSKHDGYIEAFISDVVTGESFHRNLRGDYEDITGGTITKGDVFRKTEGLVESEYLCVNEFEKKMEVPGQSDLWRMLRNENGSPKTIYTIDNLILGQDTEDAVWRQAEQFHIYKWTDHANHMWLYNDIVYRNDRFYRCLSDHSQCNPEVTSKDYFVKLDSEAESRYSQYFYMIFQNHNQVGAATFNNRLFIATGTRIVEVYLDTDQLAARPLQPYQINSTELINIGYNLLSPYPELAVRSQLDAVSASVDSLKVEKTIFGTYRITPILHLPSDDSLSNYKIRWEKLVDGKWKVLVPYRMVDGTISGPDDSPFPLDIGSIDHLEVTDANECKYRFSLASDFMTTSASASEWDVDSDYEKGDFVFVGAHVFVCQMSHKASDYHYKDDTFSLYAYRKQTDQDGNVIVSDEEDTLWQESLELEAVDLLYKTVTDEGVEVWAEKKIYDYVPNVVTGIANRSATSVLFDDSISISDSFKLIHSCRSVLVDGNKLIFYGDSYNSGQWFKTVIDNPYYIAERGSLSFKTTKNEAVVGVVHFQGNIVVFANSDDAGGSIHLVQGNGDDYDDSSGYYSPYRRTTVNASVSCDDARTIRICDNLLIFKYFRIVYYINASDLNNDVVKVTQCNDRVLESNTDVSIPWNEPCIAESTDSYYALIWSKKYEIGNDGEPILLHPGIRMKMYYKTQVERKDGSYGFPWLKDEGDVFDIVGIVYAKGRPLHFHKNIIVTYDEEQYQDLGNDYECVVKTKGMGLEYPHQYKLVERAIVSFHRDQFNPVEISLTVKNETGHPLIEPDSSKLSINDRGVIRIGSKNEEPTLRLTSTIRDDRVYNSINMFPCLLAEAKITAKTKGAFTLSSITYHYTSCDSPDITPSDLYTAVIRPKEID